MLRCGQAGRASLSGFPAGCSGPQMFGRVAEWLKAHDWKSCGLTPTWVRIPPRPLTAEPPPDGVGFEPRVEPPELCFLGSPSARWRGPRLRIPPRVRYNGDGRRPVFEPGVEGCGRFASPARLRHRCAASRLRIPPRLWFGRAGGLGGRLLGPFRRGNHLAGWVEHLPIVCIAVYGRHPHFGAWLSPVERCVRVAEVPGSNPGAPIEEQLEKIRRP